MAESTQSKTIKTCCQTGLFFKDIVREENFLFGARKWSLNRIAKVGTFLYLRLRNGEVVELDFAKVIPRRKEFGIFGSGASLRKRDLEASLTNLRTSYIPS